MSTIKCPACNLINFDSAQFCQRCKNPLRNLAYSNEGETMLVNPSPETAIRAAQPVPNIRKQALPEKQPQNNLHQQLYRFQQEEEEDGDGGGQYQYGSSNQGSQHNGFYEPGFQPPQRPQYKTGGGAWRSGTEVVLHKNATLPCCCVKCGEPYSSHNVQYSTQKFRWHNPLLYIALISPLIYCILSLALSERFSVDIPLCSSHLEERKTVKNFLIFGSLAALGAGAFFVFFDAVGMTILTFFIALLGLSVTHEYFYKPLRVKKVEKDYIYLQGASPSFLNSLPYC